jgi:hypothetical protein
MVGRRAAAPADDADVVLMKRRAHVAIPGERDRYPPFDVARFAGVGLRRQLDPRHRFHALDRLEHGAGRRRS